MTFWLLSQGERIEAFTTIKPLMEQCKSFPEDGKVYDIENFKVLSNNKGYRLSSYKFKLNFHQTTVFKESNVILQLLQETTTLFNSIKSILEETATNIELIIGLFSIFLLLYMLNWYNILT